MDEQHRAYVDELKARGELAEDWRYEWKLPKRFQPKGGRKSKAKDKAALAAVRDTPVEVVYDYAELVGAEAEEEFVPVTQAETDAPDDAGIEDDPDSIAYNKSELKRLLQAKRSVSDELFKLGTGQKEELALCKQKLALIESQEKSCRDSLNLFNKKRLDAESAANKVLIVIEPWSGDGTSKVQTWL